MVALQEIRKAVLTGEHLETARLVRGALDEGTEPRRILTEGLTAGMREIGDRWARDEAFIPEVILAARALHAGLDLVRPVLAEDAPPPVGTLVIGTVSGDLHNIGKNVVVIWFEAAGYRVIDLGVNVSTDAFVEAVRKHKPDVLGLSALLSTTMLGMKDVVDSLAEQGLRDGLFVLIGGRCTTDQAAVAFGADARAEDAPTGVALANQFLERSSGPSLEARIEGFITHLRSRGFSSEGAEAYGSSLRGFASFAAGEGCTSVAAVTPELVRAYAGTITVSSDEESELARQRLFRLRLFFNYWLREGLIVKDPSQSIETLYFQDLFYYRVDGEILGRPDLDPRCPQYLSLARHGRVIR